MASIDKRPNGQWRARWREDDHTQRAKHFDRKLDAERFLTKIRADLMTGAYIPPNAGDELFRSYVERWAAGQPWRATTRSSRQAVMDRHLLPAFGDRRLRSIARSDVQKWTAALAATYSAGTVATYYAVLAQVMRSAVEDKLIHETPCRRIALPRDGSASGALVPLSVEQVARIVDAIQARYRALVIVSAGCGLRQGEACGLTVDRVDFLRRTVTIDRQLVTVDGKGVRAVFGPTKTPKANRVVPLPEPVAVELARHLEQHPPGRQGLLFTTAAGEPIKRTLWAVEFRKAARLAGVDATSHDLRHHAASLLIAAGCSVKAVSSFLGHARAAETLDVYAHLWPTDEDKMRQAIEAAWVTDSPVSPHSVLNESSK